MSTIWTFPLRAPNPTARFLQSLSLVTFLPELYLSSQTWMCLYFTGPFPPCCVTFPTNFSSAVLAGAACLPYGTILSMPPSSNLTLEVSLWMDRMDKRFPFLVLEGRGTPAICWVTNLYGVTSSNSQSYSNLRLRQCHANNAHLCPCPLSQLQHYTPPPKKNSPTHKEAAFFLYLCVILRWEKGWERTRKKKISLGKGWCHFFDCSLQGWVHLSVNASVELWEGQRMRRLEASIDIFSHRCTLRVHGVGKDLFIYI